MRTARILLLILCSYLAGWIAVDLLVPFVQKSRRGESAEIYSTTAQTRRSMTTRRP